MSTTTPPTPTYTQLDPATQLGVINTRIQDLETQQLQVALRIQAPAPGDVISQQDQDALKQLETSLKTLRDMASALTTGGTT